MLIKRPRHLYQPRFLPYDWMPPVPRPMSEEEYYENLLFIAMESSDDEEDFDPHYNESPSYNAYVSRWWDKEAYPILREALLTLSPSLQIRAIGIGFSLVEDVWSVRPPTVPRADGSSMPTLFRRDPTAWEWDWDRWYQWWFDVARFAQGLKNTLPNVDIEYPLVTARESQPLITSAQRTALWAADHLTDSFRFPKYLGYSLGDLSHADRLHDESMLGPEHNDSPIDILIHDWNFINEWAGKVQALIAFRDATSAEVSGRQW